MTDYKHFTVPKDHDMVDEVESQDGHNDLTRLRNWAKSKQFKEDSKNVKSNTKEYIETVVEQKIQELKKRGKIK